MVTRNSPSGGFIYKDGGELADVYVLVGSEVDDAQGLEADDARAQGEQPQLRNVASTRIQGADARICAEADELGGLHGAAPLHGVDDAVV